jgi:methanogenesis multiheme c-type cytochrome
MDMEKMMKRYRWMMPIARIFGMATPEKMTQQIKDMVDCYKAMKTPGFTPVYAWYNPDTLCTEIPHPTGTREDPHSRITPFSVVEAVFFDDGTTPSVVADPNGNANGHPVPKAFVARAGGKGKRDTTLEEMRSWQEGRYKSAIIRKTSLYFQQFHSIAPAQEALQCSDCHTTQGGRLDFRALGYSAEETETLTEGW